VTPVAALLLLLLTVAWLTASATAVRSVSRIWLRHWVEQRLRGASVAELYLERSQRLLLGASTGVALAVFVGGELLATLYAGGTLLLLGRLLGAALLVLVVGQLVPRALARRWATRVLPFLLPLLRLVGLAIAPLLLVARLTARLFGPAAPPAEPTTSRDDIEDLLREGELEGVGAHDEIAIITGVVHFGEKSLADVLTPREQIFALPEDTPPPELAARIAQSGYSRVPLYRGTPDDIVGMAHVFDVLKVGPDVAPPLRPVAFSVASKPCNEQLFEMLRARRHLSVVRDESGRTVGIVTLEDLLEELVGDIRDEHDEPLPARAEGAA
jgi:putative hemolysin